MRALVSILITAYNAEDTIAYTLESAIAQTWQRKEIIVIDDGSTDRTAEVVRQFKNVKLVSTENQRFIRGPEQCVSAQSGRLHPVSGRGRSFSAG